MHADVCSFPATGQNSVCDCSVYCPFVCQRMWSHVCTLPGRSVQLCAFVCKLCTDTIFILQKKPWEWAVWTLSMSPPKLSHSPPGFWHCHWLPLGSVSPLWGCVPPFWVPGLPNTRNNIEQMCGQLRTAGPASQSLWFLVTCTGIWPLGEPRRRKARQDSPSALVCRMTDGVPGNDWGSLPKQPQRQDGTLRQI